MLSHLERLRFRPWDIVDASPDANKTRHHENRPQNVGGTGKSRLIPADEPARSGRHTTRTQPSKTKKTAGDGRSNLR